MDTQLDEPRARIAFRSVGPGIEESRINFESGDARLAHRECEGLDEARQPSLMERAY